MPEYLAPGVYVEEISSGNKPIAGVSTSTVGFVGATERGPLASQFITSWLDFRRWYGSYIDNAYLAYAVEGFFTNGGQRCFVSRIVAKSAANGKVTIDGKLNVVAIGPGKWGNAIGIAIEEASLAQNLTSKTPDEAFFVACDRTTMTQDDIDNGRLICVIGIAPIKPAEFIIFRISQKTADAAS